MATMLRNVNVGFDQFWAIYLVYLTGIDSLQACMYHPSVNHATQVVFTKVQSDKAKVPS